MEKQKQENNAETIGGQIEARVIHFFVEVTDTAL